MPKIIDKFRGDPKMVFVGVALLTMLLAFVGWGGGNVMYGGAVFFGVAGFIAVLIKALLGLVAGMLIAIITKKKEGKKQIIDIGFIVATAILLLELFAPLLNPAVGWILAVF